MKTWGNQLNQILWSKYCLTHHGLGHTNAADSGPGFYVQAVSGVCIRVNPWCSSANWRTCFFCFVLFYPRILFDVNYRLFVPPLPPKSPIQSPIPQCGCIWWWGIQGSNLSRKVKWGHKGEPWFYRIHVLIKRDIKHDKYISSLSLFLSRRGDQGGCDRYVSLLMNTPRKGPVRTQWEGGQLQTRKRDPIRNQPRRHPDLILPVSRPMRK